MSVIVCRPRILTQAQGELARRRSIEVNPGNAAEQRIVTKTPAGRRGGPRRLVLDVGKKWPRSGVDLTVQFLDNPTKELRARILSHMNAWSKTANVCFRETRGVGQVRIARLDSPASMAGYWSYLGTEILGIEDDQPTMNLEGFTMRLRESEFRRVVRHETGHTLGFEHEHLRSELVQKIDRNLAFAFYDKDQGWTKEDTTHQVLTPLARSSIMGTTEADPLSIMCYEIPAEITKDGKAIVGGTDINENDYAFAAKIYPKNSPKRADEVLENDSREQPPAQLAPAAQKPAIDSDTFHVIILDRFQASDASPPQSQFIPVLASYGGARVVGAMRVQSPKGQPRETSFYDIIRTHERIKKYTNRDSGSLPDNGQMLTFGGQLFDTLFQGDVKRLYDEARARQHGRKLDLVLTSMVPWIAEKPWEFAYDRSRASFLATEDIHFVRNVLTNIPSDSIRPQPLPLRILVAAAQPVGFGRLSIEQETEVICRGFKPLIDAGLAAVDVLPRATPSGIHAKLSTNSYTVVHFIGHAEFNKETNQGELIFEDSRGGAIRVGERSVREIFCSRGIKLVFLNACQTATGSRSDFNKGLAQSLVAHGLPALVANQYSVLDSSATHFARHFYWSIAQGISIGESAREARIAVNYAIDGESIDWAVPVVYARDPGMAICEQPKTVMRMPSAANQAAGHRTFPARPYEIAVWDIDNVFPDLGGTLAKMAGAQQTFGFQSVQLSAPLDAWYVDEKSDDGTPYLWADKLAQRLARTPAELHVDMLACITRHWMCDDDTLNIYAWWPEPDGSPVLIFSCAGFEDLEASGPITDRVIANALVTAIAGYLGDLDTHPRGSRKCPMWRNTERGFKHLRQRQVFDPTCRAWLRKKIPKELAALDALTKISF